MGTVTGWLDIELHIAQRSWHDYGVFGLFLSIWSSVLCARRLSPTQMLPLPISNFSSRVRANGAHHPDNPHPLADVIENPHSLLSGFGQAENARCAVPLPMSISFEIDAQERPLARAAASL